MIIVKIVIIQIYIAYNLLHIYIYILHILYSYIFTRLRKLADILPVIIIKCSMHNSVGANLGGGSVANISLPLTKQPLKSVRL